MKNRNEEPLHADTMANNVEEVLSKEEAAPVKEAGKEASMVQKAEEETETPVITWLHCCILLSRPHVSSHAHTSTRTGDMN
eukprot:5702909-Prymnesium_polylepis.1